MSMPARNRLIGAVHAARKASALDDDTYRAMLTRITGKSSSKDLTDGELRRVLDHMNGQKPGQRRFAPPKASNAVAGKARALWISLHALGAISDPSEHALNAWVKRQYKVDHLAFVQGAKGFAVVEGLKQWCARLGVDWAAYDDPRLCIIERQLSLFQEKFNAVPSHPARHGTGWFPITFDAILQSGFNSKQLDQVIVELGEKLRGEHV